MSQTTPQTETSPEAYVAQGQQHLSLGQLDEAEAALSRALEGRAEGGTRSLALRLLAWVMVDRRDWPAAERQWRAVLDAVREPPEQVEANQALARVMTELGEHDAAVDFAAKVCQLCRQHGLHEQLDGAVMDHAWYLLKQGRHSEGIAVITEAGDGFNPPDPNFCREYIIAFDKMGGEARDGEILARCYESGFLSRTVTRYDIRGVKMLQHCNRIDEARRIYTRCFDACADHNRFYRLIRDGSRIFSREERVGWYKKTLQRSTEMLEAAEAASSPPTAKHKIYLHNARLGALYGLQDGPGFFDAVRRFKNDPCAQEPAQAEPYAYSISEPYLYSPAHERIAARMNGLEPAPMPKVFGIGLSRTATTSLSDALRVMGFACAHFTNNYSWELINDYDIPLFDALTDNPIACQFETLYERYPQACFIYTVRPVEQWVKSISSHIHYSLDAPDFAAYQRVVAEAERFPQGEVLRQIHKQLYAGHDSFEDAYHAHNRRVRDFFAARPEARFLELNIFNGDGWPELAKFLGVPAPAAPFPWENKALGTA